MPEVPPLFKTCKKCKRLLPQTEFYRNQNMRDGLLGTCRECVLAYQRSLRTNPDTREETLLRHRRYYYESRPEILARHAAWRATLTDEQREYRKDRRHGMPPGSYRKMLAAQGGGCGVCGEPPGEKPLAFDHDHSCCPGKYGCSECVRGLLCSNCNVILGMTGEDPDRLRRLADYLTDYLQETSLRGRRSQQDTMTA